MLTLRKFTPRTTNLAVNNRRELTFIDNVVVPEPTADQVEFEVLGEIDKVQNAILGSTGSFADREALELIATMLATDPEGWDLLRNLVKRYED